MPRGAGSTSCTGSADRRQPQRAGAVGHHGMGIRLKIIIGALVAGLCVIAVAPGMAQLAPEIAARRTETLRQEMVFRDADRYTYGAPSRVDLGTQAVVRLADPLYLLVDMTSALKVLEILRLPVPDRLLGVLRGPVAVDTNAWGTVEFVPAGSIDTDDMQSWSPADMLASLEETVARKNQQQPDKQMDVRGWVQAPAYNPQTRQVTWAALILPKDAPRDSAGAVTYHGAIFGREGYIRVSIYSTTERAKAAQSLVQKFLNGITFNPGKGYDVLAPKVKESSTALAQVMNMDGLRRAPTKMPSVFADQFVPIVGGVIALLSALALTFYVWRHRRREARRW